MKTLLESLILIVILLQSPGIDAQEEKSCVAGVYKTYDDFLHNKISHRINTGMKGNAFGFLFPADLKLTVKLVSRDSTYKFEPGTIFGYTKCEDKFRYYPGGDLLAQEDFYKVEQVGGLIIYTSVFISGNEIFYSRERKTGS